MCYSDLPNVEEGETTSIPLLLVDTAGCNLPELDLPQEVSKGNEGGAQLLFDVFRVVAAYYTKAGHSV